VSERRRNRPNQRYMSPPNGEEGKRPWLGVLIVILAPSWEKVPEGRISGTSLAPIAATCQKHR